MTRVTSYQQVSQVLTSSRRCLPGKHSFRRTDHTPDHQLQQNGTNKSNWVSEAFPGLIPSQSVIQQDRHLRALSTWKQMARQLVGISEMFPYMLWASITHLCVKPVIYNIIVRSHKRSWGLSDEATTAREAHERRGINSIRKSDFIYCFFYLKPHAQATSLLINLAVCQLWWYFFCCISALMNPG